MASSPLIDQYDTAQDSLLHALYPVAAPNGSAPTAHARDFVKGIQQLDAGVVAFRVQYDRAARQYNTYLQLHQAEVQSLGGKYAELKPLPLFEAAKLTLAAGQSGRVSCQQQSLISKAIATAVATANSWVISAYISASIIHKTRQTPITMYAKTTFFRLLMPALLLTSLTLASCGRSKDCDPHPKGKCGTPTTSTPKPNGNS